MCVRSGSERMAAVGRTGRIVGMLDFQRRDPEIVEWLSRARVQGSRCRQVWSLRRLSIWSERR